MDELDRILKNIATLDEDQIFIDASDDEVLKYIADLNRKQLMKGRNSEGELLSSVGGEYTDATMQISAAEGRPKVSKMIVNLFSEGDYHGSIEYKVNRDGYESTSDPIKRDPLNGFTTNLLQRYGQETEGLDENSLNDLIKTMLHRKYVAAIENKIFK